MNSSNPMPAQEYAELVVRVKAAMQKRIASYDEKECDIRFETVELETSIPDDGMGE